MAYRLPCDMVSWTDGVKLKLSPRLQPSSYDIVRVRDDDVCQFCRDPYAATEARKVAHIIPFSDGGFVSLSWQEIGSRRQYDFYGADWLQMNDCSAYLDPWAASGQDCQQKGLVRRIHEHVANKITLCDPCERRFDDLKCSVNVFTDAPRIIFNLPPRPVPDFEFLAAPSFSVQRFGALMPLTNLSDSRTTAPDDFRRNHRTIFPNHVLLALHLVTFLNKQCRIRFELFNTFAAESKETEPSLDVHSLERDLLIRLARSSSGPERSHQGAVDRPVLIDEHLAQDRAPGTRLSGAGASTDLWPDPIPHQDGPGSYWKEPSPSSDFGEFYGVQRRNHSDPFREDKSARRNPNETGMGAMREAKRSFNNVRHDRRGSREVRPHQVWGELAAKVIPWRRLVVGDDDPTVGSCSEGEVSSEGGVSSEGYDNSGDKPKETWPRIPLSMP